MNNAHPSTPTIMVVEDDPLLLSMATRVLKSTGYQVIEASNGSMALAIARSSEGRVDLIVCDVVLPDFTGPDLIRQLRMLGQDFKILYTSGRSMEAVAGAFDLVDWDEGRGVLAKPYSPTDLVLRVQEKLHGLET